MNVTTLKYRQLRPGSSGRLKVYDWMVGAVAELEKVASLNSVAVRTSLGERRVSAEALAYSQSVREAIALQSEELHAALAKTFACCRRIEEITAENGGLLASVMLKNVQTLVATTSALIGVQPAENGQQTMSEAVTKSLPGLVARRKIVPEPGSTAFFAERVPRRHMH
ncbi:MAG TPA: phasin family protein [Paraburkholderia sp.]|jgi:hypothetical protein|nr:phasin family protein [Paraburkholderia sp.]